MHKKQIYINLGEIMLRPWVKTDAGDLVLHANNPNISKNLRDGFPYPYSLEDAHTWIDKNIKNQTGEVTAAITIDNHIIGGIGIHPMEDVYRFNWEIGFWLSEQYWGQGIMTKAVNAVCDYAFAEFDVHRIFAGVFESNPTSERLLIKAGFTKEATLKQSVFKHGVFSNEHIYTLLKKGI